MRTHNDYTVKTSAGMVSGPVETWLTAFLQVMSPEIQAKVFEQVKRMESDKLMLLNPDGTTTVVLRADKGVLKVEGAI